MRTEVVKERSTMEMWRNAPKQLKLHVSQMLDYTFAGEGARKGVFFYQVIFVVQTHDSSQFCSDSEHSQDTRCAIHNNG